MSNFDFNDPQYQLTPVEQRLYSLQKDQDSGVFKDLTEEALFDTEEGLSDWLGIRSGGVGAAGMRVGFGITDTIDKYWHNSINGPLNLTGSFEDLQEDESRLLWAEGNNPEAIERDLQDIEDDDIAWVLDAQDYRTYRSRLNFARMGTPEAQEKASTRGFVAGMALDAVPFIAAGPLSAKAALIGTSGRMAAATTGVTLNSATAISQAAKTAAQAIGRLELTGRFAAVGLAETAIYLAAKEGIDPSYDPSTTDLIYQGTLGAGFGGLIGGAAFGRMMLRQNFAEIAAASRQVRTAVTPAGTIGPVNASVVEGEVIEGGLARLRPVYEGEVIEGLPAPGLPRPIYDVDASGRLPRISLPPAPETPRLLPTLEPPSSTATVETAANVVETAEDLSQVRVKQQENWLKSTVSIKPDDPRWGSARKLGLYGPVNADGSPKGVGEVTQANLSEIVPQGRTVFHETNLTNVKLLLKRLLAGQRNLQPAVFVSDNLDLALGQGGRGYIIELDPRFINGERNVGSTPSLAFTEAQGFGTEFLVDKSLKQAVLSITVRNVKALNALRKQKGLENIFDFDNPVKTDRGLKINRNAPKSVEQAVSVAQPTAAPVTDLATVAPGTPTSAPITATATQTTTPAPAPAPTPALTQAPAPTPVPPAPPSIPTPPPPPIPPASGGGPGTWFSWVPRADWMDSLPFFGRALNQGVRGLREQNNAARLVPWLVFNARRDLGTAQGLTLFERGLFEVNQFGSNLIRGYKRAWVRYAVGNGSTNVPGTIPGIRGRALGWVRGIGRRNDFDRAVADQVRSGAMNSPLDAINQGATVVRDILRRVHNEAFEAGVRGFTSGGIMNYFPRVWRMDAIRQLVNTSDGTLDPNGLERLRLIIRAAMDRGGTRRVVIDGVEEVFTGDIDEASRAFATRLSDLARNSADTEILQHEQALQDALESLLGPVKGAGTSPTPYGRSRIILDETLTTDLGVDALGLGRTNLSIADLVENDVLSVMNKYLNSVQGAINEARFVKTFVDHLEAEGVFAASVRGAPAEFARPTTVAEIRSLLAKLGPTPSKDYYQAFDNLMQALRMEPLDTGAPFGLATTSLIARTIMYTAKGGKFAISNFGELYRTTARVGLKRMLTQLGASFEGLNNWRNFDAPVNNFAALIGQWFDPASDRLRGALIGTSDSISQEVTAASRAGRAVQRSALRTGRAYSDISLTAPVTAMTQNLTAAATVQHLWDVANRGAARLDESTVRLLGLTTRQYDDMVAFVGSGATTRRSWLGTQRVVDIPTLQANPDMMNLMRLFVRRSVANNIQDFATAGDFAPQMFSWWAKFMFQFKTFNIKGVDNFLYANISRMRRGNNQTRLNVSKEIGTMLVMTGLVKYALNANEVRQLHNQGRHKEAEELANRRLGVEGFIKGALTGPAEFWPFMQITDIAAQYGLKTEPVFNEFRMSGTSVLGAGFTFLEGATSVLQDAILPGREVTRDTIHTALGLAPFNNVLGLSDWFGILEDEIVEEYGLREQQPRK